jgi:1,2-diacylglycerol 3-beta-glucosyltransferase
VLAGALELFLVSLGLTYYVATVGAGLRVLRHARKASRNRALADAAARTGGTAGAGGVARAGGAGARVAGRRRAPAGPRPGRLAGAVLARARSGQAEELTASVAARWGRLRSRLDTAEEPPARAGVVVPPEDCVVYFVVPCMNEETVISETVGSLLSDPRALVVVVDDASDDRTGELAAAVDSSRVMVVRRELPEARLGKGPALNAGLVCVLHDAGIRGISASRITVCVMDADGRLSPGALDAVLPLFSDPRVGGVQLPVRIRNRGSLLTVMQDLEFWGVCAVAQLGRIASGTVSLGGNGQFTRLAAILEMGARPWQARLTEDLDLDLALALAVKGWRLTSTADAYVSQQGVSSLRALIIQRTRWYQGHMQAVRWLRELWSSRQLSHLAMLELTVYLLVPWVLVLPWSIIFNYNLLIMVLWILGWVSSPGLGGDLTQKIATVVFWYTLSCLPIYMAGFLYGRPERKVGYVRAFFIGHLLLGNYVTYAACWRAMYRLITGAHGWEKTQRTAERRQPGPVLTGPALAGHAPAGHAPAGPVSAGVPGAGLAGAGPRDGELAGAGLTGAGLAGAELVGAGLAGAGSPSSGLASSGLASSGLVGSGSAVGSDGVYPTAILVPGPRTAGASILADPVDSADADTTASLPVVSGPAGGRPGVSRPGDPSGRHSGRPVPGSHRASRARAGRRAAGPPR